MQTLSANSRAGQRQDDSSATRPLGGIDYEDTVDRHYQALYRFGYSLTGSEARAADLTQETYRRLLTKGASIRDPQRVKTWLFTTLYRQFLGLRRHTVRFPETPIDLAGDELPTVTTNHIDNLDAQAAVDALQQLDAKYRAPLALFYLQDLSYKEVAQALDIPIGTVMSRLSRGKAMLREHLDGGQHVHEHSNPRAAAVSWDAGAVCFAG